MAPVSSWNCKKFRSDLKRFELTMNKKDECLMKKDDHETDIKKAQEYMP